MLREVERKRLCQDQTDNIFFPLLNVPGRLGCWYQIDSFCRVPLTEKIQLLSGIYSLAIQLYAIKIPLLVIVFFKHNS